MAFNSFEKTTIDEIYFTANNPKSVRVDYELISVGDVTLLVDNNFALYSWGSNGISFRKEDHQGLFLAKFKEAYRLQLQYASGEKSNVHRYNLASCEKFFQDEQIMINNEENWHHFDINASVNLCGELHTENMDLEEAINLYNKVKLKRKELQW